MQWMDGVCDAGLDSDDDGVPVPTDLDTDNDGIPNELENTRGLDPFADADDDDVPNYLDADDRGLGVERVENRFHQEQIGAAIQQPSRGLLVGLDQLGEADVAETRPVDVGRERGRAVGGAQHARDEARTPVRGGHLFGRTPRNLCTREIQLMGERRGGSQWVAAVRVSVMQCTPVMKCAEKSRVNFTVGKRGRQRQVSAGKALSETQKIGHDAFLLDEPEFHRVLKGFLDGAAAQCGLSS